MGLIENIYNKLKGTPNTFDKYFVQLFANTALYPSSNNEFYEDSFTGNADVFTVINKITEPASMLPIFQYDENGEIVEGGKMLERINNPNPYQNRAQYLESSLTNFLIFGESFTAAQRLDYGLNKGTPGRIDVLPPKYMTVNMGSVFNPVAGYSFYPLAQAGKPDYLPEEVFHWKDFNPEYDLEGGHLRGMSRLKPLIKSVVGSTEAYNALTRAFQNQGAWGLLAILDNEGKALDLNKEQRSIIKSKFKSDSKRGDLSVVSNKAEWTKIGLTMVEMEVLRTLGIYKGNLCDAYNVPSQLLSGSQDRTYNNYKEAEQALWRNGIQPNLDAKLEGLSAWMAPMFKEDGQVLKADYSNVACLQTNNVELVQWMTAARAFTKDEIREALGYEALGTPEMQVIYESAGLMPLTDVINPPDAAIVESAMKSLKLPDYRNIKQTINH